MTICFTVNDKYKTFGGENFSDLLGSLILY